MIELLLIGAGLYLGWILMKFVFSLLFLLGVWIYAIIKG
jgi:hypothetical protein